MKAAIYTRISADNAGDAHGVSQQLAECEALAERLGWTVTERFSDNDVSAYSGRKRPGYEDLLDALRSGSVHGVIAWHTDRLHRNLSELEAFIDVCQRQGVSIQTCRAGSIDLGTASGQMVAGMLAVAARHEVAHMVERQKASHSARAAQGKFRGGRRPFGYEKDGVTPDPREAEAIKKATDHILAGGSLRAVVNEWNAAGLRSPTGNEWHPTSLRRVLLRPRNAGLMEHHGAIVGDAEWPAIVTRDDWEALKGIFGDPSRATSHTRERRWIGSSVYECGKCGQNMAAATTNRGVKIYRCMGGHLTRSLEPLDNYIAEVVLARLGAPDAALTLGRNDDGVDVPGLRVRRDGLQSQANELAALFAEGAVDASQLKIGTEAIRAKIADVDAQLGAARARSPLTDLVLAGEELAETWAALSADLKGKVIAELMRVTVMPVPRGERNKGFNPEYVQIEWK